LATGLDDEYKKPKNIADQMVRTLDEPSIIASDRLRLIALYLLYRDGLVEGDVLKLLAHAQLPPSDGKILDNLALLGARVHKPLQDNKPPSPSTFAPRKAPVSDEDHGLSRFDPAVKIMLEELARGSLDTSSFPYVKPPEHDRPGIGNEAYSQSSLRSARPNWVTNRSMSTEPRQRIIVFMAGGATYAEARACYEITNSTSRDVFLATSHMVNPGLFLRQVGDLSVDRRRLNIPADRPKPRAPAHLFEPEPRPSAPSSTSSNSTRPPTASMAAMKLKPLPDANGGPSSGKAAPIPLSAGGEKLKKRSNEKEKEEKKKKHHFFSSKK
jgi:syntaxin-binding protein 1